MCLQRLDANIPELYEIYFFKIYVKFEVFLAHLFENYCIGVASGKGYCPNRKLEFIDKEHLSPKSKIKAYDYLEELSNNDAEMEVSIRTFSICAKIFETAEGDSDFTDEDAKSMIKEQMKLQAQRNGRNKKGKY